MARPTPRREFQRKFTRRDDCVLTFPAVLFCFPQRFNYASKRTYERDRSCVWSLLSAHGTPALRSTPTGVSRRAC
eukprot:7391823-Pyramimonas_sp.AAC.1